tara:strand:+ start:282 stop:983 length:702 start_codon:yes stop_codon:yes gene_type:complete
MSYKSILQVFILILIAIIFFSLYLVYFSSPNEIIEDNKSGITNLNKIEETQESLKIEKSPKKEIEKKISLNEKDVSKKENSKNDSIDKIQEDNVLSEVEYLATDDKGNKYQIFAKSGKTSSDNKDVLDLNKVRGKILSDFRSTIYIVSDFAKYNSVDLSSKFYNNVVINFEDKQIDCDYFIINMNTNIAKAYGNVVVTDPKSVMYAGIITLDIKTKDININPENKKKIKIITE